MKDLFGYGLSIYKGVADKSLMKFTETIKHKLNPMIKALYEYGGGTQLSYDQPVVPPGAPWHDVAWELTKRAATSFSFASQFGNIFDYVMNGSKGLAEALAPLGATWTKTERSVTWDQWRESSIEDREQWMQSLSRSDREKTRKQFKERGRIDERLSNNWRRYRETIQYVDQKARREAKKAAEGGNMKEAIRILREAGLSGPQTRRVLAPYRRIKRLRVKQRARARKQKRSPYIDKTRTLKEQLGAPGYWESKE